MDNSKSIVKQASILAVAGIFVRIIGVLYRSPLTALIGDEGIGYYSTAYNIYAMILLISSYSIPTAISKLISEQIAIKQYKNAKKILQCSFIYICVIGGSAALIAFFIAPYIVPKYAVFALRILCPTIFLSGLVGVLRGYFQAHSTTLYTSVSQIIEQIFNAVVSIGAAWLFIQPFINGNHSLMASYGAGGSALGTGAGVLIALVYMTFMFLRKKNKMIDESDGIEYIDTSKAIFKSILSIVTPIIISTCIFNIVTTVDMYIYYFFMNYKGMDSVLMSQLYGVYSGKFMVLINVPIALASAMSTASIPAVSGSYITQNFKETRKLINNGINATMLVLIPSFIGMAVLSYPIMGTLFPQKQTLQIAATVLTVGSPAIGFYGLSTFTNGILQALGHVKEPLKNASKALIIYAMMLSICLFLLPKEWALYILAACNIGYAAIVCFLNQRALSRILNFKIHLRRTVLLPLLASIFMGVVVYLVYHGLFNLTRMVFIPLFISIIIGIVVYFIVVLYLYKDHPEYLSNIPYVDRILRKINH